MRVKDPRRRGTLPEKKSSIKKGTIKYRFGLVKLEQDNFDPSFDYF